MSLAPQIAVDTPAGDGEFKAPAPPTGAVEKQQEEMLKSKYGNLKNKGGSAMLRNRLAARGGNKYFDSGDYNMAKARVGPNQKPAEVPTGDHMPTPDELPRVRKGSQSNLVSLPRHLQR